MIDYILFAHICLSANHTFWFIVHVHTDTHRKTHTNACTSAVLALRDVGQTGNIFVKQYVHSQGL